MKSTTLHIKNMVCDRCIMVVSGSMTSLGYTVEGIELGKVSIEEIPDEDGIVKIGELLSENGFELIDDKKLRLINSIKTLIIEQIHYDSQKPEYVNLSDFLATKLAYDYSYLSNLFSSHEGVTIEKYVIRQKIERVKELLEYDEYTLNEISYQLGYSSVQHLSNQFKKDTGFTPSQFRKNEEKNRKPLDKV